MCCVAVEIIFSVYSLKLLLESLDCTIQIANSRDNDEDDDGDDDDETFIGTQLFCTSIKLIRK